MSRTQTQFFRGFGRNVAGWRASLGLFLLASLAGAAASSWSTRDWQADDGLPNNAVRSVAQTSDGYLWLATPTHLARFDGIHFETVPLKQAGLRPLEHVSVVLAARDGSLWMGTSEGMVIQLKDGVVRTITNGVPSTLVRTMVEDSEGGIWLTQVRGFICRVKDGTGKTLLQREGLPGGPSPSVTVDNEGVVWFARGGTVGSFREGRFKALIELEQRSDRAIRLCAAREGGIWICYGSQLFHYRAGDRLKPQGTFLPPSAMVEPSCLMEDPQGGVWIGTSAHGLFRFQDGEFERIETSHPDIQSLLEDREGNLWVPTFGGGLNRVRPRVIQLENAATGLPYDILRSLCEDASGVIWAATQNGLLVRKTEAGWETVSDQTNWPSGRAWCVTPAADGGIWVGTGARSVFHLRDGRYTNLRLGRESIGRSTHCLLVSRSGDLWVAQSSSNSLSRLRGNRWQSFPLSDNIGVLQAFVEEASGDIWAGTSRGILLRVHGEELVDETTLVAGEGSSICALHVAEDGSLWMGFAGAGLGRLKDRQFSRVTSAQGLYNDNISQILSDESGWLWFGSEHGIFKVSQAELEAVTEGRAARVRSVHYGRDEGLKRLQANYGNSPMAVRGKDGRLWMPTRNGLVVVRPEAETRLTTPPPVMLKRVQVDGQPLVGPGTALLGPETAVPSARLSPLFRRLVFDFAALSFVRPENDYFRYRLMGLEEEWTEVRAQQSVAYSRLAPGAYRFEVKACNSDGLWSENPAVFAFVVSPFFWQTWWFRLTVLAGVTLGVAAVVRYVFLRRLRLRLRAVEQQAALDRERGRIAKDLHDDLGASMTRMTLLLELASQRGAELGGAAGHVSEGLSAAREAIKSLDAAVWAVNPRNNTLPELIDYLGQFAVEFLKNTPIRCSLDLPEHPPERPVSAELRHNLFLILKEALNNVVRHSHATEMRLQIAINETELVMSIKDNGCGFERAPENKSADGLQNMRQRAEMISGQFEIESRPGAGTRLRVRYRWPQD